MDKGAWWAAVAESGMIEVTWHVCVHISTWASQVALVVKKPPANAGDAKAEISLGLEGSLEQEITTCPSILAWKIPWREEPGGLQSMGPQRVRHGHG